MRTSIFSSLLGSALLCGAISGIGCVVEESSTNGAGGDAGAAGASAGAAGTAGTGGSSAGAGGAAGAAGYAGTGGSTAGSGGSTAGSGGSTAGSGGSTAGSGGSTAGSGGSTAGSGGATAGAAGWTGGSGGATAGAGGSTAGSGGATAGAAGWTGGSGGATAGAGGSAAGAGGWAGGAGGGTGGSGGSINPAGVYLRVAHLAPIQNAPALDFCIDAVGGDFSAATPILASAGDNGTFYWPAVTIWLELDSPGDYAMRFVPAGATNCNTPVSASKLQNATLPTLGTGTSTTVIVYGTNANNIAGSLDLLAFGDPDGGGSNVAFGFVNVAANLSSGSVDFLTAGGNDLAIGVPKFDGTTKSVAPFNDKVAIWKTGSTASDKALAVTLDATNAQAGGTFTAFAGGINEFAPKQTSPWAIVCNNQSTTPGFGTAVIADCVYSQTF